MKKIFTLTLVFLTMMFGVNAQYLLQEGFENGIPSTWITVDADGDGDIWSVIGMDGHNSDGCATSKSYNNDIGALTPDNWLITPAVNLTVNANLTFWVCAQDASWAAEHYGVYISTTAGTTPADFTLVYEETIDADGGSRVQGAWKQKTVNLSNYTGQTVRIAFRHFNCTDMFYINLDDVEIFAQPTGPTIIASTANVDFGAIQLGSTANSTMDIVTYNLTAGVTATTTAPFAVSSNGTTYGTTATVAAAGGTLYMRYTPTAAGTDNGTVTLSSTGATDVTIALAGSAIDCSNNPIPYSYSFDNEGLFECWQIIDANNDGKTFTYNDGDIYYPYDLANAADDWLISPRFTLNGNQIASFDYRARSASYPEKFQVFAIGADTVALTGVITTNITTYQTQYLNLSTLTGSYSIAIHCVSDANQFWLYITNFNVNDATANLSLSETALDFGSIPMGTTSSPMTVVMTSINVNEPITLTVAAPYEISIDGNTYATTQTIPANPSLVVTDDIYVRFAPTTAGTFNGALYVSSTNFNDTVTLVGSAIDCSNNPLPYATNFDDEGHNLCWEIVDANNDGSTFHFSINDSLAYYQYNSNNIADDWLISPALTLTGEQFCYMDYAANSSLYAEKFQVFAIDANNNNTALTGIIETSSTDFQTLTIDLTALTGNYRIGIHCVSDADKYYLLIANFNVNNDIPAPSLAIAPEALDFGTIPAGNTSMVETVVMSTINLNEAFNLATSAPFEISLDGINFATTLTIPANADMVVENDIYVRFAPTAAGTFNQNLTITSASQNGTVALTGAAVDCANSAITSFPFVNDFNDGFPICWGYNDPDNYIVANVDEAGTDKAIGVIGLDMLVTPEITSNSAMALMFDYRGYLGNYYDESPSTFRVGYSSTNSDLSSFTWLETITVDSYPEEGTIFFNHACNIPANAKYIAFDFNYLASYTQSFSIYDDVIYFDNVRLVTDGGIFVSTANLNFGNIIAGTISAPKAVNVTTALLNNNVSVTAPANFEVSANGTSYASTASLPSNGGTLYVRYNPSTAGNHTGSITLTSGSANATINVAGSATDCSAPQNLPFFEGFEDEELGNCWAALDEDGDGYTWMNAGMDPYDGDGCISSASYINDVGALDPDNWLISPTLAIPSQGAKLSFYVAAQDASYPEEHYGVYVSTTGTNPDNFTLLYEEDLDADGGPRVQGEWKEKNVNLPYGGQNIHIAIRHFNVSDMYWINLDNFSVTPGTSVNNHEGVRTVVYPNPATNVLNIDASCDINRVEVYNMMGQMVGSYNVNGMTIQINTNSFANGVYTVKIATENGTTTQKFTVAR